MPHYIIHEIQRVRAVRRVEADSEDEARELFDDGMGASVGCDGDVIDAEFVSITLDESVGQ